MYKLGQECAITPKLVTDSVDCEQPHANASWSDSSCPEYIIDMYIYQHEICSLSIIPFVTNLYFFTDLKKC